MPARKAAANSSNNNSPGEIRSGLVIINYSKHQLVEDASGNLHRCVARRGLPQIVCGDLVEWLPTGDGTGVIETIMPRRSVLQRTTGNTTRRPLAANIDQIIIEAALEPALDSFLIDKYTIAAELARTEPLIVINKADLLRPKARGRIEDLMDEYQAIGYTVLLTSALHNTGIEAFMDCLANKTSILVGQSGVGKSSLIKRLLPDHDITVGKLSAASGLGKHTTTATTLYHLPHGGMLIDSPGVRDFRLGDVPATELAQGFREFQPWLGHCKFNDCRHLSEPGCAINAALTDGHISARRMESYRKLLQGTDE
jgi:ribosome biogenesis GTPase